MYKALLSFALGLLLFASSATAQFRWERIAGTHNVAPRYLAFNRNGNMVIGNKGVFFTSTDAGNHWTLVQPPQGATRYDEIGFAPDSKIYGLAHATDSLKYLCRCSSTGALEAIIDSGDFRKLSTSRQGAIMVIRDSDVLIESTSGIEWNRVAIPSHLSINDAYETRTHARLIASDTCVYRQAADSTEWVQVARFTIPSNLYESPSGWIYLEGGYNNLVSTDDGQTWRNDIVYFPAQNQNGDKVRLDDAVQYQSNGVGRTLEELRYSTALACDSNGTFWISGSRYYPSDSTEYGVYRLHDTTVEQSINYPLSSFEYLFVHSHFLLTHSEDGYSAYSTDGGRSWRERYYYLDRLTNSNQQYYEDSSHDLITGDSYGDVKYRSIDTGRTWQPVFPSNGSGATSFAVTPQGDYFMSFGPVIRRSRDRGQHWDTVLTTFRAYAPSIVALKDRIIVNGLSSTDDGDSWQDFGSPDDYYFANGNAVLRNGREVSLDEGATWRLLPVGHDLTGIAITSEGGVFVTHSYWYNPQSNLPQLGYIAPNDTVVHDIQASLDEWGPGIKASSIIVTKNNDVYAVVPPIGIFKGVGTLPVAKVATSQAVPHTYAYPNPATDYVVVNTNGMLKGPVRLLDVLGRESDVRIEVRASDIVVSTRSLANGSYCIALGAGFMPVRFQVAH